LFDSFYSIYQLLESLFGQCIFSSRTKKQAPVSKEFYCTQVLSAENNHLCKIIFWSYTSAANNNQIDQIAKINLIYTPYFIFYLFISKTYNIEIIKGNIIRHGEFMDKKLICAILFLALSVPYAAFAESEDETPGATEEAEAIESTDEAVEETADATPALESGNGWRTVRTPEMGNSGKIVHMVLVEQSRHTDKTIYSNAISRICQGEEEFCRVRFWSNERFVPERAALTAEQNKQMKADYLINKAAGIRELRWSCGVDPNSQNCIR